MIASKLTPAAPLAQSQTKGKSKPFKCAKHWVKKSTYLLKISYFWHFVLFGICSFESTSAHTLWPSFVISSPKKLSVPIVILKPLYSFGLCEPVIIIFASKTPLKTL